MDVEECDVCMLDVVVVMCVKVIQYCPQIMWEHPLVFKVVDHLIISPLPMTTEIQPLLPRMLSNHCHQECLVTTATKNVLALS